MLNLTEFNLCLPPGIVYKPYCNLSRNYFRVDFSNGLLSQKIKKRVEKLNSHNPLAYGSNDDVLPGADVNLNAEQQTETPSYAISNSLADRLATDSQSTDQNALYGRYVFSGPIFYIFTK